MKNGFWKAAVLTSALVVPMASWASVQDTVEPKLYFATEGVQQVLLQNNIFAKTILHHDRALASKNIGEVMKDYSPSSTLIAGPGGTTSGGVFEYKGLNEIQAGTQGFFDAFFSANPDFTITSAIQENLIVFQTVAFNPAPGVICTGGDTLMTLFGKIVFQTLAFECHPI
jgi:hypothetical protein